MDTDWLFRDLIIEITFYVYHYYGVFISKPIYPELPELPLPLRAAIQRHVSNTLLDDSLLQLTSRLVNTTDPKQLMTRAYVNSYREEFTDENFIEWAITISTLSAFLEHRGIEGASEISIVVIKIVTRDRDRYGAFRSLGCNLIKYL